MTLHLITATIAAALGFGAAWTWQGRAIDTLKLEQRDDIITQQRAARATTERLTSAVRTAQTDAATRAPRLAADRDSAANSGNGLRVTSADSVRASTDDLNACTASLAAHGVVLSESIGFIHYVAAEADQCASHAVMLQDAWPK
jgi:hypothetical protein